MFAIKSALVIWFTLVKRVVGACGKVWYHLKFSLFKSTIELAPVSEVTMMEGYRHGPAVGAVAVPITAKSSMFDPAF